MQVRDRDLLVLPVRVGRRARAVVDRVDPLLGELRHRRPRLLRSDVRNELAQLSRPRIRARFEERFTARRMAEEYLDIYRGLIAGNRRRRPKAVNGTKPVDQHIDDRHQIGTDRGLYVAD